MAKQYSKMKKRMPVTGTMPSISPKTMAMVVLLSVMGILWGRVLLKGKGGPASAKAQDVNGQQPVVVETRDASDVLIEAVKLPVLEGRNDVLTKDLFSTSNWTAFDLDSKDTESSNPVKPVENDREAVLKRITGRLTLEAVVCDGQGKPLQAFVDDKILTVGMSLTVQEGPDRYELTLTKLSEKEAVLKWQDISVVLKMAEPFEF